MTNKIVPITKPEVIQFPYELQSSFMRRYNPDDLIGVKGYAIYKQMAMDEQIKVVTAFRKNATASRKFSFYYEENIDLPETEKQYRIELFEFIFDEVFGTLKDSFRGMLSSIDYGFSLTEKVFKPVDYEGKSYWGIKSLRTKPFETFVFDVDDYGELKAVRQFVGAKELVFKLEKFIHHVHNRDKNEYYGQSELRECYRSWFSKDELIKLENIYCERQAGGLIWVGREKDAPGVKDVSALENGLRNISPKTGMLLPAGYNLNVEQPTSTDAYERAINRHDQAMAKALLMPNLLGYSNQASTGSYAQSKVQLESFLWLLESEADDLAVTINEQLIKELGVYNFADGLAPNFKFNPLSNSEKHNIATVWSDLVSKGAVQRTDTDEAYIRELLDFPEKGEVAQPVQPGMADENQDDENQDDENQDDENQGDENQDEDHHDETISGKVIDIDYMRFNKALKRVDFKLIASDAKIQQEKHKLLLAEVLTDATRQIVEDFKNSDVMNDPSKVNKIRVSTKHHTKIKQRAKSLLQEGWRIGISNASREMEPEKRFDRKTFARFTSIGDLAQKYFEGKGYAITNGLSKEIDVVFQNVILQGIKYGRTTSQVVHDFLDGLASRGMVDPVYYEDELGDLLDTENPMHRLDTIVRTNTFEAINEARFQFFTDPELGGFVEALEYSAILDDRVTEICKNLNGKVYLATSDLWDRYRPPNHYNCRSLLIAVTTRDDIPISLDEPTIAPNEGFK